MSISTQRGDDGSTDLMFGRRVPKTDLRVAACGDIDELNAVTGVARTSAVLDETKTGLAEIQSELITLMGELMVLDDDRERYFKAGHEPVSAAMVEGLTSRVKRLEEAGELRFNDWAVPGGVDSPGAAHLDVCRTVCRRAERGVAAVAEAGLLANQEIQRYLNRLSDVLWLMARWEERSGGPGTPRTVA